MCVGGAVREAWEKREGDLGEENRVLRGWEKEGVGEPSRLLRTKTRNRKQERAQGGAHETLWLQEASQPVYETLPQLHFTAVGTTRGHAEWQARRP